MRTWGRVTDKLTGKKTWVEVTTDANGLDDLVWTTTLLQVLQLAPGESPFYANYGIPAQRAVITQFFPDYYVTLTQSQFSQYFAALVVSKVDNAIDPRAGAPMPYYNIKIVTNVGISLEARVAQ